MDAFLFATALSLSAYIPRYLFDSRTEQVTMFLSMGLSLSLFGLTLVEAMPKSSLIFLTQDSLTTFYRILLWMISIHIVIVLPSLVGASFMDSFGYMFWAKTTTGSPNHDKKYQIFSWKRLPWWIRFTLGFFHILVKNIICRGVRCCSGRRWSMGENASSNNTASANKNLSSLGSSSALVMTVHDEDMLMVQKSSSSGDLEMPCSSVSPNNNNNTNGIQTSLQHYYQTRRGLWIALGGLVGIGTTVLLLSSVGPMVVNIQPPTENETTILSKIVSWLCAVGLLLSSLLNGFGSVSLPFTYLSGMFLKQVRPETITKLSAELRSMQDALAKKRSMLKELTVEVSTHQARVSGTTLSRSSASSASNKGCFGKNTSTTPSFMMQNNNNTFGFSDLKEELKNRRNILQTEIDFLEDLVRETSLDIEELKYSQSMAAAARTSIGKLKSWIGILFSIILLVRLLNAGFSIWRSHAWNTDVLHKKSHNDIVTTTLLWLAGRNYVSHKRYNMLSQMVSLALTAVLSFTQVRTFLRTVTFVNRRLSRFYKNCYCGSSCTGSSGNSGSSIDRDMGNLALCNVSFHSQMIAGFLGCYSLACIVLIKMMLPEEFTVAFSRALGDTGMFTIHASAVNLVFFSSAVVSTSILGMLLGIQRQNNLRHAGSSSEKGYHGPDV